MPSTVPLWYAISLHDGRRSFLFLALILLAGGDAAADMPLRLIFLQHALDLEIQGPVKRGQTFAQILMFRRDELERFRLSPNLQANVGKYPHSHPYPLRFSG